jgi:signal transduction histidine kinase
VLRHAQASRVSVLLDWQANTGEAAGEARVIVEDNGRGFDPETTTKRLGLTGMRERAALVGGTLEIESACGQGTTVFLRLPLVTAADTAGAAQK